MSLIFNPQEVPVVATDVHLPALAHASMQPQALRERFAAPPAWTPEFQFERRLTERHPAFASVLVALVTRDQPSVLLTRRTDHLTDHPGQISFPGGRAEPEDAGAIATALREAHEEIGLEPHEVEVLGCLPTYTTVTAFIVTPVVALVQPGFKIMPDPFEVAEVFEVPLLHVMTPAHHQHHVVDFQGVRREFLSMPWLGVDGDGHAQRYFIWGATAAMLRNLYRFLAA